MKALAIGVLAAVVPACALPEGTLNDQEVITTVILQFGDHEFAFDDPDGEGGEPPSIDPIVLGPGSYALAVRFQNRLEDPPEEITDEVADEADQHLLLFTGSAVVGPATANTTGPLQHAYADADASGLPIGLANDVVVTPGDGMLTVTLRHLPPELPPQKSAATVADARASGVDAIGGATDAQVSFSVVVP